MPYISHVGATTTTDANNVTVALPTGNYTTGDLLLICLTSQATGAFTANTAGWTLIGTAAANGSRQQWAYKIAASASETDPNFSGSNDAWICAPFVVKDFDPTTPIAGWQRKDWGTAFSTDSNTSVAASSNAGAVIQPAADSLLLYSLGSSDGNYLLGSGVDLLGNYLSYRSIGTNSVSHVIGYRNPNASGDAPNATFYSKANVVSGNVWVIEIANSSGGNREQQTLALDRIVNYYGPIGEAIRAFGTVGAPSSIAATINGITCSSTAATFSSNVSGAFTGTSWDNSSGLSSVEVTASAWVGGVTTLADGPIDMSGKTFALRHRQNNNSGSNAGSEGQIIVFVDGQVTPAWVAYKVAPQSILALTGFSAQVASFIRLGSAEVYDSSGTIDWTDIEKIGYLAHRSGSQTNDQTIVFRDAYLLGTTVITGGGSGRPATFIRASENLASWYQSRFMDLQASSQLQAKTDVQIGDGSKFTYFKATAQSMEFPVAFSPETVIPVKYEWNTNADAVNLTIYASASDTIDLSAGLFATQTSQAFTIHASSSTSATYSFTGASFVGWTVTWKTGVPCIGATFKGCGEIDAKGAAFTNCTIAETTSADAAIAFTESAGEMDGCTTDVTDTNAEYHIEVGDGGTGDFAITLTDHTFTGTAGTDKVHVTNTSGTTTINISGTTTLAAGDVTTAGATVSIVSDPVYQSVVVSGFTAGSRIQIYDTTNTTELFNGTASSGDTVVSGSTATWTDPATATGNRAIRGRVAYVNGATAKAFVELTGLTCGTSSSNASITYPVTQVDDETYNDNAIDGPSIYATSGITFTDAATDLVNCNIAGGTVSWPTIYACFVYWLFTAAGIDDDVTYIDAPDTANYLLTAMKIRNTNANPLTITSGYGRSATTGLVADIIDTAGSTGNIFPSPDHVVSYATGSGVTAQDKVDIAAEVLDQASSAPIYADVRRVLGTTVTGSGTEADPWGP